MCGLNGCSTSDLEQSGSEFESQWAILYIKLYGKPEQEIYIWTAFTSDSQGVSPYRYNQRLTYAVYVFV